jgi:PPM family protein phosphatase
MPMVGETSERRQEKWRIGRVTHPGRLRELNEDSLYVNADAGLFVLADGMGGHNAGEVASALAVALVSALIEEELETAEDCEELVRAAVANANTVILGKSANKAAWSEMGTTLVLALLRNREMVIAHVGDSRAYSITKREIRQLTEDHTFVADWLKNGLITKEQARAHPQRHGLTEALGVTDEVEIELLVRKRERDECLLLCSDGLTDMIDDADIFRIIARATDPQQACRKFVEAANAHGGTDNISVILVCPDG